MKIKLKVRTGKKRFSITNGDEWVVDLKARAEHGKANSELIKELNKIYGNVRIVKGFKSKRKIVEII